VFDAERRRECAKIAERASWTADVADGCRACMLTPETTREDVRQTDETRRRRERLRREIDDTRRRRERERREIDETRRRRERERREDRFGFGKEFGTSDTVPNK
jgi:molecular chaperone GrpE (heat shock protein)